MVNLPIKEAQLSPVNEITRQLGLKANRSTKYGLTAPRSVSEGTGVPSLSARFGAHAYKHTIITIREVHRQPSYNSEVLVARYGCIVPKKRTCANVR